MYAYFLEITSSLTSEECLFLPGDVCSTKALVKVSEFQCPAWPARDGSLWPGLQVDHTLWHESEE